MLGQMLPQGQHPTLERGVCPDGRTQPAAGESPEIRLPLETEVFSSQRMILT
jgi:hypothetical protein